MRDYFATPRPEVLPHLPSRVTRLLDVGCGAGATVAAIKATRPVAWAGGVEVVADQTERAKAVCDRVWCLDIERERFETEIDPASLDLILCLDVLEHLVDPWTVVRRLSKLLAPGGRLVNIDWDDRESPVGPPPRRRVPREQFLRDARRAGLAPAGEHRFLPYQYFLVMRPRRR